VEFSNTDQNQHEAENDHGWPFPNRDLPDHDYFPPITIMIGQITIMMPRSKS